MIFNGIKSKQSSLTSCASVKTRISFQTKHEQHHIDWYLITGVLNEHEHKRHKLAL